ncbi:MAG TPA: hypothetical protein VHG93_13300 [Longimicrobium sp.]|nr:hypothetical protein [Longimicrobium sp.]
MPLPLRPLLRAALLLAAAAFARPAAAQDPVQICRTQPVPQGWVVVAMGMKDDCPGAQAASYNSITIRVPGDTVTVCNSLSQLGQGYVATGQRSLEQCPNYYGGRPNATSYRRVPQPPVQNPPPVTAGDGGSGGLALMDEYDRTVFARLEEMEEMAGLRRPTHHVWLSRLAHGAAGRTSMRVEGGMRYTLVAVCDADCNDVDLRVLDGGRVLAQDVGAEGEATLQLSPARSGTLTVEAVMASCRHSPCRFAVAAYQTPRPGGDPPRRPRP